jgi:flavin-binding protein dodecin
MTRRRDVTATTVKQVSASSARSFDDAVFQGLARAAKGLEAYDAAHVKDLKVDVQEKTVRLYRIEMTVAFQTEP